MSLTIRRGIQADAARLSELAARTFRETFAAENRPEDVALHVVQAYGISQQVAELVDPRITTLLAEVDEQLAGYAQLRSSTIPECVTGDAPLELWRLYIAQLWQGQGVAQALLGSVEMEARRRGARARCGLGYGSAMSERRRFTVSAALRTWGHMCLWSARTRRRIAFWSGRSQTSPAPPNQQMQTDRPIGA